MNPLRLLTMPLETLEQAITGDYKVQGDLKDADCVIGFSFGYRGKGRHIEPGLSNQDLANVAIRHYGSLPKILQWEIGDAYLQQNKGSHPPIVRISKHRQKGKYLDTREVAVQAKEAMRQRGYKRAVLLAHPYHMPRVQAACSKVGIDWVATADLKGAVEFDPQSTQKWTRNVEAWRGYEPLAMSFYRMKGWS